MNRRDRRLKRAIRALSWLAPPSARPGWRDEWLAEIDATAPADADRCHTQPLWRTLAAAAGHIVWLWRREWRLEMLAADGRFALRTLRRRPGFALAVVGTLALSLGATTAIFAVVNAVLLRPLPYPEADRLMLVWPNVSLAPVHVGGLPDRPDVFAAIGGYSGWGFTVSDGAQAELASGARVSPGVLRAFAVQPIAGRLFQMDEDQPGSDFVLLVSERVAWRRYGGPASAIGRRLIVNGDAVTIVGVMPSGFAFPDRRSDYWSPLTVDPARSDYRSSFATLVARLAPSATPGQARAVMRGYAEALARESPKRFTDAFIASATVVSMQEHLVRDLEQPLVLLFAGVGVLLLIACANVGGLLVGRAESRRGEIALRLALGAGRGRLVRQLLTESLVIAALGGLVGLFLAHVLLSALIPFLPETLAHASAPAIDLPVVLFLLALTVLTAVVFGLVPALRLSRSMAGALAERGVDHSAGGGRLRGVLVFAEVALATLLVVSAVLLARSFLSLTRVPVGFDAGAVLSLRVSAPASAYAEPANVTEVYARLFDDLARLDGVQAAGAIHLLPLTPDNWNPEVMIRGASLATSAPDVNWRVVTPQYFAAMGIPLRRGRVFTSRDDADGPPVAMVNETFARTLFAGADPIGQRLHTGFERENVWAEVVGVVGDVRQHTLSEPARPEMYRPFAQHPLRTLRVMVRAADPPAIAPSVRARIAGVGRDLAVGEVEPMTTVVDRTLGSRRLPLLLASLFAAAAAALGVVGIVGVLSFDIARRRREIGVRLALGAAPGRIIGGVVGRGTMLAGAGILAGLLLAILTSRVLSAMLFGVTATDPLTLAGVAIAFAAVMALASYGPARRAAGVDVVRTLRAE